MDIKQKTALIQAIHEYAGALSDMNWQMDQGYNQKTINRSKEYCAQTQDTLFNLIETLSNGVLICKEGGFNPLDHEQTK